MKLKGITLFIIIVMITMTGSLAFAQDLKIEFQLYATSNTPGSYFTFTGPIRYIAADKDYVDSATGASKQNSTEMFQPYRYDVKGKNALPDGLRGLFLFAVANYETRVGDNLQVVKAGDGTITINYVHRGTAYQLISDRSGNFQLPNGSYKKRVIGYIKGAGPQVISRDFSSDGTAARVDWDKVWNERTPSGRVVTTGVDNKTGPVTADVAASDSMYYWNGALQASLEANNLLKVSGGLNAVKR